jgi:hypothetical protein
MARQEVGSVVEHWLDDRPPRVNDIHVSVLWKLVEKVVHALFVSLAAQLEIEKR